MSESKILEKPEKALADEWRVGPGAWLSLIIVLLVFSGFFLKSTVWRGWGRLTSLRLAVHSAP